MHVIDSVKMQNGSFVFSGKVEYADQVAIQLSEKHHSNFILENCEIVLDAKATIGERGYGEVEMEVSGSELNDELKKADNGAKAIFDDEKYDILNELQDKMRQAYQSKDEAKIAAAKKEFEPYQKLSEERFAEYMNYKIEYAKANPSSVAAPYVLSFMFSEGRMTKEQMKQVYPMFTGDATKTAMYAYYTKTYDEIFKKLGIGAPAPDFTLPTLDGGKLTLSKVKGKYIFIDFWASWCVPCRASFPHLKEVYKKYHKDGFEVVAVGSADVGSRWKKAIDEDKTGWLHVFDGDPTDENRKKSYGEVCQMYGGPFLPTTFLIDANGTIVARQLRGEELDKKMKELYGY